MSYSKILFIPNSNDEYAFQQIFQSNIYPRLTPGTKLRYGITCTTFFKECSDNILSPLKELPEDLQNLFKYKPFYSLEFIQEIHDFRKLQSFQQRAKLINLMNSLYPNGELEIEPGKCSLKNFIYTHQGYRNCLSNLYQGYKEGLFTLEDLKNWLQEKGGESILHCILCHNNGLKILREGLATGPELFQFGRNLDEIRTIGIDYTKCPEVEVILSDDGIKALKTQKITLSKALNMSYEELLDSVQEPEPNEENTNTSRRCIIC